MPTSPPALTVAPGRAVAVQYRLSLEGGVTIDAPLAPLWYVHGQGGLPVSLQKAITGKAKGDVVTVVIEPAEAFGLRNEALVVTVPRAGLESIEVGARLQSDRPGAASGLVRRVDEASVTVDFNPEFAGAPIVVRLEIADVAAALPAQPGSQR